MGTWQQACAHCQQVLLILQVNAVLPASSPLIAAEVQLLQVLFQQLNQLGTLQFTGFAHQDAPIRRQQDAEG